MTESIFVTRDPNKSPRIIGSPTAFRPVLYIMVALGFTFGCTISRAQCVVGTNASLSFNGSDDICYIPDSSLLEGFDDFTIEVWIKTTISPNPQTIVGKWFDDMPSFPLDVYTLYVNFQGLPRVELASGPIATTIFGTIPVATGSWAHIAVVRTGSNVSIMVNGAPAGSGTFAGTLNSTSTPISIGDGLNSSGGTPYNSSHFAGTIDELRIWSLARTPSQIQAAMNIGLAGTEAGLVGYWRFDAGSGQLLANSASITGSAVNGTLGLNIGVQLEDPTWSSIDFAPLIYCTGCGAGNANSAMASLQINGMGAIGVAGPYMIAGASGTLLTFQWNGPANQPLILAMGPPSAGCTVVPGLGTIDIGTPPSYNDVQFLFNGLLPPASYFFVTNSTGVSLQSFLMPTVPGLSFALQGIVVQPPGTSLYGVLPTASFQIQL